MGDDAERQILYHFYGTPVRLPSYQEAQSLLRIFPPPVAGRGRLSRHLSANSGIPSRDGLQGLNNFRRSRVDDFRPEDAPLPNEIPRSSIMRPSHTHSRASSHRTQSASRLLAKRDPLAPRTRRSAQSSDEENKQTTSDITRLQHGRSCNELRRPQSQHRSLSPTDVRDVFSKDPGEECALTDDSSD